MRVGVAIVWLLGAIACGFGEEVKQENDVYVLTISNHDSFLKDNELVLVEYYAPWCGHCKALEPEYAMAAKDLHEKTDVKLAKLDATSDPDNPEGKALADKLKIQGFPTIKFYKNGTPMEYTGGRVAPEIIAWVNKKTGPPAVIVDSVEKVEELANANSVMLLGLFSKEDSVAAKAYLSVASELDDPVFAISTSEKLKKHYGKEGDAIVLLKQFDDKRADLEGELTANEITDFVKKNWLPWVMEFSESNGPKIFGGDITEHVILFGDVAGDEMKKFMDCFTENAKSYLGKFMHITIDTAKEDNANVIQYFGVKKEDPVAVRIVQLGEDMKKYAPTGAVTCELFKTFTEEFLEGKVKEFKLTEDVPEDWDKNPVKVLVGKNFEEVARKKGKFVFVEFYAPWCGHCKSLEPVWEELGKAFADNDQVVIAKLDATANELDGIAIAGFPTLKMFVNNEDMEILEYEGPRELDEMKSYVEKVLKGERPTYEQDHDHDHEGDHDHEHEGERVADEADKKPTKAKKDDHDEL